ncbi:MAG: hypothetical protein HUJ22_08970 [Gracilimonas sp.]|uniref:hypothetical protein n=1 Tax=Gracilimonas sp. TaxID=1974203 RepID=UPI0019B34C52|nr:hypothetical protein [Gracilimonas sp.]MBD3616693.1 hypothetical protein [Gracilimonas sp.]
MHKRIRLKLLSLLFIMFVSGLQPGIHAQNDPYENNYDFDEKDSRHFEQVEDRYHNYFVEGEYELILESLLLDFLDQDSLWAEDKVLDEKRKFITAVTAFINTYKKVKKGGIDADQIDNNFADIEQYDAFFGTPLSYFSSDPELKITITPDSLDSLHVIDLRYRIHAIQRIADRMTNDDRIEAERTLNELNEQWDNFHFKGKSQYPWEFLVNSWLLREKGALTEPPKSQLVLLHPNISFELDTGDLDALKSYQVFNVEVLGVAWGFNNYTSSLGISGAVSFSNQFGNGYGGMLSWNNFQLGALYHNSIKRVNLLVTMDLLKLIQNGEKQWESLRE